MELVYLWVEDYKNIHKQGFNFSPRFNCEYDETNNELTIDENEDYVNIFPENINITAIVGKNGSGKSSILEVLLDVLKRKGEIEENKIIFLVYMNAKLYYFSEIEPIEQNRTKYNLISLNFMEFQKNIPYDNILIDNIYINEEDKDRINYDYIEYKEDIIYNLISKLDNPNLAITSFMYSPYKFTIKKNEKIIEAFEINIRPLEEIYNQVLKLNEQYDNEIKKKLLYYSEYNSKHILELYFLQLLIKKNIEAIKDIFNNIVIPEHDEDSIYIDKIDIDRKKLINKVDELNLNKEKYNFSELDYILKKKEYIVSNISNRDKEIISKYKKFLIFDFIDKKSRKYSDLSYGEKSIYGQILKVASFLEEHNSAILLFDESTNSFHPEWQRKYFDELINAVKYNTIYLVITSHSPFLISDLPKENIIFLDTYKEEDEEVKKEKQKVGNCKVLPQGEVLEKKQTFGANIHTLLSDSFFMNDGLMGEFAKSKINEIKKIYLLINNKKVQEKLKDIRVKNLAKVAFKRRKNRLWNIQKIIGEPYLQKIIKNYLDELEILFSDDNTLIDKELKELEKRKEYLESLKK